MNSIGVIILAAGYGKRMRSARPKVLMKIGGSPLLIHILRQVHRAIPNAKIGIVVGHQKEMIIECIEADPDLKKLTIEYIVQSEPKGTGHAAKAAMHTEWAEKLSREKAAILILPGDLPLLSTSLIEQMVEPLSRSSALRLLTCDLPNPTGYGRIVRKGKKGKVIRIVEEKDANPREKLISEVGASIYCFQSPFLKAAIEFLSDKNSQGEYYLTDVIARASRMKKEIEVLQWKDPLEVRGVNDPWELTLASRYLNERCIMNWALEGVRFADPLSTWVDSTVTIEGDVDVGPGVLLQGNTRIEKGAEIGSHVLLKNVTVKTGAVIKKGTVAYDSTIGEKAQIGPYAHLRPGSRVGSECKIGNFVELKETEIGAHTSVAHLSYLGDAKVGERVNIGCGFVTCNFDGRTIEGRRKHPTIIEDDAFIGSDCQAVAPVKIRKGAYVASGSTITQDVEEGALAIARSRQVNKAGYAARLRGKNKEETA